MEIKELLPIGSVVLLRGGVKKIMVTGIKQTNRDDGQEYDYIGVIYPEGFLGAQYQFVFNHPEVEQVIFRGYEDEERTQFISRLAGFYGE